MSTIAEEILMHYGMPRRSGRYPYGSGEDPYQHDRDFLGRVEELKKTGWTETPENIMKEFGLTTTQYRTEKSIAKNERRALNVAKAKSLKEYGLGDTEIGRRLGVNESTVRSWLNAESEARMKKAEETANILKKHVDEKGMIDVGAGVERELGVSKEKLNAALATLEEQGYHVFGGRVPQVTNPGKQTTLKVLAPPDTPYKINEKGKKVSSEIYNFENIHTIDDYTSHDGGVTFDKLVYPKSLDSKRLMIRYKDDVGPDGASGIDKDGIIEVRRGVDDLSLGNSRYAQVRILVDDNRYLKGMAVYSDNMPDGVDVIFNTNKEPSVAKMDVLKKIKDDPDNPFGALIKASGQSYYIDKDGNRQLSAINKTREEGDWDEWKDKLPSQFLSKQSLHMAKKQLDLATADKNAEFDELMSLNNPTVKKHRLQSFADDCDKAAIDLQAAALPGQKYHVIVPINNLKDNEVYAPGYEPGTKLALIRYPHGGTFEIPILTVTHKNSIAEKIIGKESIDAVGINKAVADRLSGADFDGDTVMCIPTHDKNGKVRITSTDPRNTKGLQELIDFDPKTKYSWDDKTVDADGTEHYFRNGQEFKIMKNTGTQMGIVSNLITDMTLQGASWDKIARAVKHSMVVIDAEKHKLDYKQSERDNNIAALKKEFQTGGASTLISRAKGETSVLKRQGTPKVNLKGKEWYDPTRPEGALIYKTADDLEYTVRKVNKRTGEITTVTKTRKQPSTKMAETDDAFTLVSEANTAMERLYAEYANNMKSLANRARVEMATTGKIAYSSAAKATYQAEVKSLMDKLDTSLLNAPRERRAQLLANTEVNKKLKDNPDMKPGEIKKAGQQALTKYRKEVGAKRTPILITDKEWEAIQAGAVSENTLIKILNNTDADNLRQRATPRASTTLSQAKINKIKSMQNSNYTLAEIAKSIGVSTSTVSNYLKGD